MVDTINRKFGYTKQEVERVIVGHPLQAMLGSHSQSDFEGMVCSNMIVHAYLNVGDCKRSSD